MKSEPLTREALHRFIDDVRPRCLWYLRKDYYPTTRKQMLDVLSAIERQSNVETFQRARAFRQWLLRNFNDASAGS